MVQAHERRQFLFARTASKRASDSNDVHYGRRRLYVFAFCSDASKSAKIFRAESGGEFGSRRQCGSARRVQSHFDRIYSKAGEVASGCVCDESSLIAVRDNKVQEPQCNGWGSFLFSGGY